MRLFYRVGVELVPPNRFSSKNIKRKFLVQKLPPLIVCAVFITLPMAVYCTNPCVVALHNIGITFFDL